MATIQSKDYGETEDRLTKDPIVIAMAEDLKGLPFHSHGWLHEDDSPTFSFMQLVNGEYRKRGGQDGGHIGAIAVAILRLVK
jgi:hypothetical protein